MKSTKYGRHLHFVGDIGLEPISLSAHSKSRACLPISTIPFRFGKHNTEIIIIKPSRHDRTRTCDLTTQWVRSNQLSYMLSLSGFHQHRLRLYSCKSSPRCMHSPRLSKPILAPSSEGKKLKPFRYNYRQTDFCYA